MADPFTVGSNMVQFLLTPFSTAFYHLVHQIELNVGSKVGVGVWQGIELGEGRRKNEEQDKQGGQWSYYIIWEMWTAEHIQYQHHSITLAIISSKESQKLLKLFFKFMLEMVVDDRLAENN